MSNFCQKKQRLLFFLATFEHLLRKKGETFKEISSNLCAQGDETYCLLCSTSYIDICNILQPMRS